MLTNILVVPLSTLIIYAGVLLLVLGAVPLIPFFLAKILIGLVWTLNQTVCFVEELPFAVTRGIYISIFITAGLYAAIVALALFLVKKKKRFLVFFILVTVGIYTGLIFRKVHRINSVKMIIYGARNLPAADFINGRKSVFLYHPGVKNNIYFTENHMMTYESMDVRKTTAIMMRNADNRLPGFSFDGWFFIRGGFISFFDKRIYILNKKLPGKINRRIRLDYLIISGNPSVKMEEILRVFEVKEIIVDPSNSGWRSDAWKREGTVRGANVYIVTEKGARVMDFSRQKRICVSE
jgi:competence protein ComEC